MYWPAAEFTNLASYTTSSCRCQTYLGKSPSNSSLTRPFRIAARNQFVSWACCCVRARSQIEASALGLGSPVKDGTSLCSGLPTYIARAATLSRFTPAGGATTRTRGLCLFGALTVTILTCLAQQYPTALQERLEIRHSTVVDARVWAGEAPQGRVGRESEAHIYCTSMTAANE